MGLLATLYLFGGAYAAVIGEKNFALFAMCTGLLFFAFYMISGDRDTREQMEQKNRNQYK